MTKFLQMIVKAHEPAKEEIADFIGEPAKEAWAEIRGFIEERYVKCLPRATVASEYLPDATSPSNRRKNIRLQ